MKKTKILFDISHGIHGSTGIQQDMRRTLSFLIKQDDFEIDFIVYDMINSVNYINFDIEDNINKYGEIVAQSRLLSYFFNPAGESSLGGGRFLGRIKRWNYRRSLVNKNKVEFLKINKKFNELIYKKLLKDGGTKDLLEKFKKSSVLMSTFSTESLILGMMNENYKIPTLNTSEYDLAIFFQEIPFKISINTKKVVRTYDLIQILGPDVVFKADYKSNYQCKSIKTCIEQKTIFSTISNTVKDQLNYFFGNDFIAQTIYVPISDVFKKTNDKFSISDYARTCVVQDKGFNNLVPDMDFNYFLSVSTIEPRKNITTAYQSFKQLKMKDGHGNLKFILVGKIGWNLDNAYKNMFQDPDVIVLQNVPTRDLPHIYSNAKALIYIPFQEGFGVPPAEAMSCGCPVILSDIPVHREVHGDTPLFVNHYDIDEVYQQMKWIMDSKNISKVNKLKIKGLDYVEKFRTVNLGKEWVSFIKKILES
jgi:glycosyltransferase involved in cell wall biosynthesis